MFYKKTPCEKCHTENCSSKGTRNTFFNDKNICSRYTRSEQELLDKQIEKLKRELEKNPIRIF